MIDKLKITNFRKYKEYEVEFNNNLVIITGDNTKGKSTIIEAIFLVTNGESPWSDFSDGFNTGQEEKDRYFRIEVISEGKSYSYFRDENKRQLKIDGRNVLAKRYFENISSILFSPDQIDLLMISPSKRRDFLDKLIAKLDIEYSDILSKYQRALKQRNAILKKLAKRFYELGEVADTDPQLIYWTDILSSFYTKIIQRRSETIQRLKTADFELTYKPSVTFNMFEDLIKDDDIKEIIADQIMGSARRDIALGYTNIGAHRDDWVIFRGKDVKRFGSRGEKRMAIGKLIFLTLDLESEKKEKRPILLLDDISSELDKKNVKAILTDEIIGKQQTFITTINISSIPKEVIKKAQLIEL